MGPGGRGYWAQSPIALPQLSLTGPRFQHSFGRGFLPWVLQPLVIGAREGSPRRAAAKSAVAVALMGGVNATIVVSALPLAVIWLFTRAPGPRRRSLMRWWIVCVGMACFWWAVATILQGKYGYNYLPYTETPAITTSPGSAFEAIRGTSNWQN